MANNHHNAPRIDNAGLRVRIAALSAALLSDEPLDITVDDIDLVDVLDLTSETTTADSVEK